MGVTVGRSRSGVMALPESIGGSADRRGDRGNAAERWVAGFGSVPGEGGDLAGLNLLVLVEESGERVDESAGVAAGSWECLGRDENQPWVFQPGGPVLGVGWDEVLAVGGDQCERWPLRG